jgi:hypothetical protein
MNPELESRVGGLPLLKAKPHSHQSPTHMKAFFTFQFPPMNM